MTVTPIPGAVDRLRRRLAARAPTPQQQLLGLAADLDAVAMRGAAPGELDGLARWAESIAARMEGPR